MNNSGHTYCNQTWTTGRSCFMPELYSWKMSHRSNTKFSFKTVYFLGIRGL